MKDTVNMKDNLSVEKQLEHPLPGELLIARHCLVSRDIRDGSRSPECDRVQSGQVAVVVNCHSIGKQLRLLVLVHDKLMLFSHKPHRVTLNWAKVSST